MCYTYGNIPQIPQQNPQEKADSTISTWIHNKSRFHNFHNFHMFLKYHKKASQGCQNSQESIDSLQLLTRAQEKLHYKQGSLHTTEPPISTNTTKNHQYQQTPQRTTNTNKQYTTERQKHHKYTLNIPQISANTTPQNHQPYQQEAEYHKSTPLAIAPVPLKI